MSLKKQIITDRKTIRFLYHFIRTYSSTYRTKITNEKKWIKLIENGEKVILCCWHQQFFPYIKHFKNYKKFNPALMISQSKDGEMIAGVANLTGWHTARGSSTRGGRTALEEMIHWINDNSLGAHILDGPTGPAGVVKNGIVKMALDTKAHIVPMYIVTDNDWHVSSWDKFIIPKPLSKVEIKFDDPILIEQTSDTDKMEEIRLQLENQMKPYLKYF